VLRSTAEWMQGATHDRSDAIYDNVYSPDDTAGRKKNYDDFELGVRYHWIRPVKGIFNVLSQYVKLFRLNLLNLENDEEELELVNYMYSAGCAVDDYTHRDFLALVHSKVRLTRMNITADTIRRLESGMCSVTHYKIQPALCVKLVHFMIKAVEVLQINRDPSNHKLIAFTGTDGLVHRFKPEACFASFENAVNEFHVYARLFRVHLPAMYCDSFDTVNPFAFAVLDAEGHLV
jgi:hypothetical protein